MKIIDIRMRPPFKPYLGKNNMFDTKATNPFAISKFYKNFGMNMSKSMKTASIEDLFKEMDQVGEVTGVVSIRKNQNGFENDALTDLLAKYPKRFLGACGIPAAGEKETLPILQKYICEGPCVAAFMEPGFHGIKIDDEKIFSTYEFCEKNNIPLMISFGGFHGNTDDFCLPIYADHIAATFPNLKIALCHGGWPWVTAAVRLAFKAPNVYLSPDIYALHAAGAVDYIEAANYMLREKFIYGSAYPCVDLQSSVKLYLEKLRPEVVEDIMYNNAVRFLNLK